MVTDAGNAPAVCETRRDGLLCTRVCFSLVVSVRGTGCVATNLGSWSRWMRASDSDIETV